MKFSPRRTWKEKTFICLELLFTTTSQNKIAKKYGITEGMISRYRKGLGISPEARARLAAVVKIPPEALELFNK